MGGLANLRPQLESVFLIHNVFDYKVVMSLQSKSLKPCGLFFINMLNELSIYVLVVRSAHQKRRNSPMLLR